MSGPRRKSRMREMKPSRNREVVAAAAACKVALEVPPLLPAEAEVEGEAAFGSSRSGDPQVEDSTRPCRPCWEGWTFKEAN